ncbi:TPA: proline hydroxylase, partial [Legionella pneumophila]|nr:proline hydroxylase [Legionella pneumophila]
VIFKNNILHCIKKVENAAGNHVRASITGFFMSNDKIQEVKGGLKRPFIYNY